MKRRNIVWLFSAAVTLGIFIVVCFYLYKVYNTYHPHPEQIIDHDALEQYLNKNWPYESAKKEYGKALYIPTGLFVKALKFIDYNTVFVSGYVWQKYDNESAKIASKGVVFPEGTKSLLVESFRQQFADHLVIGWHFETELVENFDYSAFPLDEQTVWFRMWHSEFDKNVVLVPDFAAYDSTLMTDKFGLDPEIVLSGYRLMETYFSFRKSNYNSNFGLKNYVGKNGFPELYFNVVIKRNAMEAIVVYMLPLAMVLALAFFSILLITVKDSHLSFLGYNLSNLINLAALLLFIILLSHIQIRTNMFSDSIMYIEIVYYIVYVVIVYSVVVAFALDKYGMQKDVGGIWADDGFFIKATFLPLVLLALLIVTAMYFR